MRKPREDWQYPVYWKVHEVERRGDRVVVIMRRGWSRPTEGPFYQTVRDLRGRAIDSIARWFQWNSNNLQDALAKSDDYRRIW